MNVPAGWQLLDLHNHSDYSYDAINRLEHYERAHAAGRFDVLGVTDHNLLDGALDMQQRASFPVVTGMEIDTTDGELIGLFLTTPIAIGRSAAETAAAIHEQGGIVYLQHPFYRLVRRPLSPETREVLVRDGLIDVVEVRNGGPFTGRPDRRAAIWAKQNGLPCVGSSDAHEPADIGQIVTAVPPGPLDPADLLERVRSGLIVDQHRLSMAQIATKARHRFFAELPRRLRGQPRKRRYP
jgi:predicted metal-dependent phosphoesterase TrpH